MKIAASDAPRAPFNMVSLEARSGLDDRAIFHKTNDSSVPGVGDYTIGNIGIELLKKSPKATIGR